MIKSVGKYGLFLVSALALLVFLVGFELYYFEKEKDLLSQWIYVFYAMLIILMLIVRRIFQDRTKPIIDFGLILIILFWISHLWYFNMLTAAVFPNPQHFVRRALNYEDMVPLSGRSFVKDNITESENFVRFNSPHERPTIKWVKTTTPFMMDIPSSIIVDSEGNTWYSSGPDRLDNLFSITLNCIKPDGTIKWVRNFPGYHFIGPKIVCQNAVVCFGTTFKLSNLQATSNIECLDLDGKTIWRTGPIPDSDGGKLLRFTDNRVVLGDWKVKGEQLYLYALSDGQLLDTKFYDQCGSSPHELPDGRLLSGIDLYIGEKPRLGMFNLDTSIEWTFELPVEERGCNFIQVSDNDLLLGTYGNLGKIDFSGKLVWHKVSNNSSFMPLGVLKDGNYLVCETKMQHDSLLAEIMCVYDPEGNIKWSHEFKNSGYIDPSIVIYQDGNILFGHKTGISLISPNLEVIWNLELLGADSKKILSWNIFPAPDGRIVAACWLVSNHKSVVKIFSLSKFE